MTFSMWSFGHYLFIASPVIFLLILQFFTKRLTYNEKRRIGVWFSIIAIIILILRNIEIFITGGYAFNAELVPLQICHFANFVLLYAYLKDSKPAFSFALLFNLPAAIMSIIFANSLTNYSTLITFRAFAYIFGHMLIVGLTLYALLNGFILLNKKIFGKTLLIVFILYASSLIMNNLFRIFLSSNANFFYTFKPEEGTPLEIFFKWGNNLSIGQFIVNPVYLLATMCLGFVIISILYAILFPISQKMYRKKR